MSTIFFSCSMALFLVFVYFLWKCDKLLYSIDEKLTQHEPPGTVLIPVTKLNPNTECSTVLPLPIGAEMCTHKMDKLTV